eukprot:469865-Amorphochlora_amoeboformis.AAC.1
MVLKKILTCANDIIGARSDEIRRSPAPTSTHGQGDRRLNGSRYRLWLPEQGLGNPEGNSLG